MVRLRRGRVTGVAAERPGAVELHVDVDGERRTALAYLELVGPIQVGDEVLLNTSAVELGLGTGGMDFVVADLRPGGGWEGSLPGRVVKARYTPLQTVVSAVEETHAGELEASAGLQGTPVVVAPLHSMIGPIAAGARAAGATRVVYVMTDGAALPGSFSRLVPRLRDAGLLDGFVTTGQAFGGRLEAVTVWTGLLAAKEIDGADVIVVADGPGNTGTDTRWGVSALGAGQALNAVPVMGGRPIAALRVSFADPRPRHRGLSHHSRTILQDVCLVPAVVAVPRLQGEQREALWSALRGLPERYEAVEADGGGALALLAERRVEVDSMGRTSAMDPAFFLAAGAAGAIAGRMVSDSGSGQPPAR